MNIQLRRAVTQFLSYLEIPAVAYVDETKNVLVYNDRFLSFSGGWDPNELAEAVAAEAAPSGEEERTLSVGTLLKTDRTLFFGALSRRRNIQFRLDLEYYRLEYGSRHLVLVLLDDSGHRSFHTRYGVLTPRIFWTDKEQNVISAGVLLRQEMREGSGNDRDESVFSGKLPPFRKFSAAERDMLKSGLPFSQSMEMISDPFGDTRLFQVGRLPIPGKDGVAGVLTALQPVLSKEAHREFLSELLSENSVLRLAAEKSGHVAVRIDLENPGYACYVSERISRFGYDAEELRSHALSWMEDLVAEEDRERVWRYLRRNPEEREPDSDCCYRICGKGGREVWVLHNAVRHRAYKGRRVSEGIVRLCPLEQISWYRDREEE